MISGVHDDATRAATGDTGPWVRHLPTAWRAIADPEGDHPLPERGFDGNDDRIAWWSPLLQVLLFGCGWPRPDLGLVHWLRAGRPTDDPRLALVERWWGVAVQELVAWSCATESNMHEIVLRTAEATGTHTVLKPQPDEWARTRERSEWREAWTGGYDVMHLADHVLIPVYEPPASSRLVIGEAPTATRSGSAVLMLDGYLGWYRTLHTLGAALPTVPGMRSWRVDVVCQPLGWLGTYRRSRSTGRWFAGRHRWHELGVP
jgi:hypothetical protein